MSFSGYPRSSRPPPPPPPESLKTSLRRRLAGWAGIEDRPPVLQDSWWFYDNSSVAGRGRQHHGHQARRADSADTASVSSLGRCDSDSTSQGDGPSSAGEVLSSGATSGQGGSGKKRRSRKRDWFKVLLAARNLATVVYALSYTTTLPVLPFMANKLIYPQDSEGPDDPGSDGVPEAWRAMAYGLVMSGYYLTKMISAPWIGFLSDKVGRRQALVVTLLGGALSFFVTKIWGQYSIQGLIMCRLLMGCFAANGALMHAYIRDTVPPEWQSSAFSQHSASWGCAYLAAPAIIAWAEDSADAILTVATVTMVISAIIVEITFVDTRPEGSRTQRMSRVVSEYIIEGARDLAEVGKKMSGLDLADYFNSGREKEPSPPPPPPPLMPPPLPQPHATAPGGTSAREEQRLTYGRNDSSEGLRYRKVARGGSSGSAGANGDLAEMNGCSALEASSGDDDDGGSAHGHPPEGGGAGDALVGTEGEAEKGGRKGRPGAWSMLSRALVDVFKGMTIRALVDVFKGMIKERLVLVTFVLQAVRPAQDLAPLVALKFSGGASVLAGITSSRSLCRVLVPMTPLIPWLVRFAGGSSSEGAAARVGGDRAVAAFMCVLMAGLVVFVPAVGTLRELHHLMAFKGLCHIVRESTAGAVMAQAAGTASVGAFFGWQHCIKGIQGSVSHFLTGWLSGYSIAMPYYVVAVCDLFYAFTYLFI